MGHEYIGKDLQTTHEMAPEDRMWSMSALEWPTAVLDLRPEETSRMLVLQATNPLGVSSAKEESDHRVFEGSIEKIVDDPPKAFETPDRRECFGVARSLHAGYHPTALHSRETTNRPPDMDN